MYLVPLLLAVTTLAQDSVPRAPEARPAKRGRAPVTVPLAVSVPSLDAAAVALAASQIQLEQLTLTAPQIAASAVELALPALEMLSALEEALPLESSDGQDPADSLYRAARQLLNRGRYRDAITLFRRVHEGHAQSRYAGDALYYEAFALYRVGDTDGLRQAQARLTQQAQHYSDASTARRDARVLLRRVQGELARRGDATAAAAISAEAQAQAEESRSRSRSVSPPRPPTPARPPTPPRPPRPTRGSGCEDEDDVRTAALNALLQMDAELAVPTLKAVLARRDTGSACLRRRAVFIVSQKRSPETATILLDAVRTDPDQEVREQAVFWLSQVPGEASVTALDSVLRASNDPEIQEKAIFALSQHRSERAGASLRAFVERDNVPVELRGNAIFWLGQHKGEEGQAFLRGLYPRLQSPDLKERVLFALSQRQSEENMRWLLQVALNDREDIEIRKNALFWAGQSRSAPISEFAALYDRVREREIKEHLIFVFSQRSRDPAAVDKLFAIAKNEPDQELRKKAIFWIGQSRDPRAAQFLQELINQ